MKLNRHIFYLLFIIALAALLMLQRCYSGKQQELLTLQQQVLNDSLRITKDKLGRSTATIANIEATHGNFKKLIFAERDSLARELQKVVTRNTQSAAIVTLQVNVDTILKTDSVYITANEDSCRPTYSLILTDKFQQGFITASADSFHINLSYPEQLTIETKWSKWKFFKPRESTSVLKNQNPYVDITGFRTYTVKCDCSKKSWISFALGNVSGFAVGFGSGVVYQKLK